MNEKVCVVGLGYIGLPSACLIADASFCVVGVDIDKQVIENLKKCKIDITEPDLLPLLKKCLFKGDLDFFDSPTEADFFLICTPTPVKFLKNKVEPDLSFVFQAIYSLAPYLKNKNSIIIESTVPIGTIEKIKTYISELRPDISEIFLAYCPERVLPGNIIFELKNNTRIVGGIDQVSTNKITDFYKKFVLGDILKTTCKIAEMCKLAENAYRDVNIGFANELSLICNDNNISVSDVINLTNRHPRVKILKPGIGVGGHCIPVDPWFLISENHERTKIMRAAREVNQDKTIFVYQDIEKKIKMFSEKNNRLPIISFLGITYKENSNDIREAPALNIIKKLRQTFTNFFIVDPYVDEVINIKTKNIDLALKDSDIAVILVKHKQFEKIRSISHSKLIIFDYTNV